MSGIIESGMAGPLPAPGRGSALLVLGAGGRAGGGVVDAALAAGRRVIAAGDDAAALCALAGRHPGAALQVVAQPIASDADAAGLARRLRALRQPIDGVVAAIGRAQPCGRLLDEAADVLQRTLDDDLLPHLFAARHLFPLLPRGADGYVLVGGPGGQHPWAGYGHCSIAAAALRMMARVLHDEAATHGLRVQMLAVEPPLTPCGLERSGDAPRRATEIGRRALALLARGHHAAAPSARAADALPTDAVLPAGNHLPARDLHAARALLAAVASPMSPGNFHDERC